MVLQLQEEEAFRIHARKIEAERDQALFICQLQYDGGGPSSTPSGDKGCSSAPATVACQELCKASVDFQYLSRTLLDAQGILAPDTKWQLLRAYR